MSDYTIGVAMIARNGGKMIRKALSPFAKLHKDGLIDEIAVVFGGKSQDNTEELAKRYATKTAHYDGPLDDDGRLLDFAAARQKSFDLCNTDWCIVVDTDDIWRNAGEIRSVIDRSPDPENACVIWCPYSLGDGQFHQPRIFRRNAGHWDSAIHERFLISDDLKSASNSIKTGAIRIEQQNRPDEMNNERIQQNIAIGSKVIEDQPQNYRAASQLCNDHIIAGDFEAALSVTNHYLERWAADSERKYDDDLSHVWARRGIAQINTGDYPNAVLSEIWALGTFERGANWTYLSEALLKMGMSIVEQLPPDVDTRVRSEAIFDMAIFSADKALETGLTRSGYVDDPSLTTYKPLAIKAMALLGKQDGRRALSTLDLGLAISPHNEMMLDLRSNVANSLGEVL